MAQSYVRKYHFCGSYLKPNKVSKGEGTRKLKMYIIYDSVLMRADAVYPKLSKSVCGCRNCSLPKLACFLRQSVATSVVVVLDGISGFLDAVGFLGVQTAT